MKKEILFGLLGVIAGILVTLVILYSQAPGLMLLEDESPYGFDETVTKFVDSVEANEWEIPHTYDLKKSMKKFGHDVKEVKVFELCHPDHSSKILKLNDERIVSTLMPCRIAIYEKDDGKTYVSRMNSGMMAKPMGGAIAEVMSIAASQNEDILAPVLQ